MSNLLEKHLKKEVRYKEEDLIVYEPKQPQIIQIREILSNTLNIDNELHVKGVVEVDTIKYLIKNLTNIGDEIDNYEDEDILNLIDSDGDRVLKNIMRELLKILNEIIEDIQNEHYEKIQLIASVIDSVNANEDVDALKKKYDKLMNKQKHKNNIIKNQKSKK